MASIIPPHPVEKNNQTKEFDEQSIIPPHPNKKDGPSQEFKEQSIIPPTGSSYSKYFGKYKGSGLLKNFEIKEKDGKLIADTSVGDVELTLVSGNKFKGKKFGTDFEVEFTISNNVVTGGKGTAAGDTLNFTKDSSTTPSKEEDEEPEPPSPWDCIEKFNKDFNQLGLYDRDDFRFEKITAKYNGRNTIIMYYKNYDAVWAYDDKKPILNGKWECSGDSGYLIKWSNGKVSNYNAKDDGGGGLSTQTTTNTNTGTNTLENPCVNGYKKGCVSEEDILNKKKALKVCSKCDLVKKVQENPEIKARIFTIQKELGKEQKIDDLFGPIMLKAVKDFQSSNGINPTGNVGEKTLTMINSYSAPKVDNNEPAINKTEVNNEPEINKAEVKPEIPPIYKKRTLRQVSFDEEL
jgi:peptidoglycan hydrolase-like protein with peptidoglycan-binding domain